MTKIDQFVRSLRTNGYDEHYDEGRHSFSKEGDRKYLSLTVLRNGWIGVYQREYPSSEGWARYNCRVSEAAKLVGWI